MTSTSLFDALENCLQALEQGADLESCLVRYPDLAEDLRPILIAALQAREARVAEVPAAVARRGKARLLQAAAEMREQRRPAASLPFWRKKGFFGARFYRLALTTALMLAFLLTGGTGLVNASTGAIPGDRLYPVKRGWEDLRLVLIFDEEAREKLEHQFKQERVEEIEELYSEKRMEQVNFQGLVQSQESRLWVIGGLQIEIEDETVFQGDIPLGATVQVLGETDDGRIKAEQIILISAPQSTPTSRPPSLPTPLPAATSAPEEVEKPSETETVEAQKEPEKQETGESEKPEGSSSPEADKAESDQPEADKPASEAPEADQPESEGGSD